MIQILHIARMAERLPVVAALARAMDLHPEALRQRIKRGAPDLSRRESEALRDFLDAAGLAVRGDAADE